MKKVFGFIFLVMVMFLYACNGNDQIKITFEVNGGQPLETMTISKTDTSINLPEPTKEGHTFIGWYKDIELNEPFQLQSLLSSGPTLTLYAKWSLNVSTYQINFVLNNDSTLEPLLFEAGSAISLPTVTKVGHTFVGFYIDIAFTIPFTETLMPSENITLYAKWQINTYQIIFEENGGNEVSDLSLSYQANIPVLPTNLDKTGYEFIGWSTSNTVFQSFNLTQMPANQVTLYAFYEPLSYSITYQNEHFTVDSVDLDFSAPIILPVLTHKGYTFMGWFMDQAKTTPVTIVTMPNENLILYAKWQINSYTIGFETYGGTSISSMTYTYDETLTLPVPTKIGHTFIKYYLDSGFIDSFEYTKMPDQNLVLHAKYEPNLYAIIFEENGGSLVANIEAPYLSLITKPNDPTKLGYYFEGWFSDEALLEPFVFDKMPLDGITLYAKWIIPSFSLTLQIDNQVISETYLLGETIDLGLDPVKVGHQFIGYYENNQLFDLTIMPERDILLVAKFEVLSYEIRFGNIAKEKMVLEYGGLITITNPVKEGYTFVGFYLDDLLSIPFDETHMPAMNLLLFAKFEINIYALKLLIDGNETVIQLQYNEYYELPVPVKVDYVFLGFFESYPTSNRITSLTMPAQDLTLHAIFDLYEGYEFIIDVVYSSNSDIVTIKGEITHIVSYTIHPSVIIYDGTYSINVYGDFSAFELNDVVIFDAQLMMNNYVPTLLVKSDIVLSTGAYTEIPYHLDIETVNDYDYYDLSIYGKKVVITALLYDNGYNLLLTSEQGMIYATIKSEYNSFLNDYVMKLITIEGYIVTVTPYDTFEMVIIPDSIELVILSPEDILDAIEAMGIEFLNNSAFYQESTLELPNALPYYNAVLSFETFGDNAIYYDVSTGLFMPTEVERQIDLMVTVSIGEDTYTLYFYIILKPSVLMSFQDFLSMDEMSYVKFEAIVVDQILDMGVTVLSFEGNKVLAINARPLEKGMKVIVYGYKVIEFELLLVAHESDPVYQIISEDNPIDIMPLTLDVEAFRQLDTSLTILWFRPVVVTGTLLFNETHRHFYLTNGDNSFMIQVLDYEIEQYFFNFVGLEVQLDGLIVPDFGTFSSLIVVSTSKDDIMPLTLDDLTRINFAFIQLETFFNQNHFEKGTFVTYPLNLNLYDTEVLLSVDENDLNFFDLDPLRVKQDLEGTYTATIILTISYGEESETYYIDIYIGDIVYTISYALNHPNKVVQLEVIALMDTYEGGLIVADETGTMVVLTNITISAYEKLIIEGYFQLDSPKIFMSDNEVIISRETSVFESPYESLKTIDEIRALEKGGFSYFYLPVDLQGIIKLGHSGYYFEDLTGKTIKISSFDQNLYDTFNTLLNKLVSISAFTDYHDDDYSIILFKQTDVKPIEDETVILDIIANRIIANLESFYYPGYEIYIFNEIFEYDHLTISLTSDDPNFIDGMISPYLETETFVFFDIVLKLNDTEMTYSVSVLVIPVTYSTISEVLAFQSNQIVNIKANVLFSTTDHSIDFMIIYDNTGYMFIKGKHFLELGDSVYITGMTTMYNNKLALSENKISFNLSNEPFIFDEPIPTQMSIANISNLDLSNDFGLYISVNGTLVYDYDASRLYLTNGFNRIHVSDYYEAYDLYQYIQFDVVLKGFIVNNPYTNTHMLVIKDGSEIELDYDSDADKITALIQMGAQYYEEQIFYPFMLLEMPTTFEVLGATLSFNILEGQAFLNMDNEIVQITEPGLIKLEVTVTINGESQVIIYEVIIEPYQTTDIIDLLNYDQQTFVKITGVVLAKMDWRYVIQDETGMVLVDGYSGIHVGDLVNVYGHISNSGGQVIINGYSEMSTVEFVDYDIAIPVLTESSIYQLNHKQDKYNDLMFYTSLEGFIIEDDFDFYISDGFNRVLIYGDYSMIYDDLYPHINTFVSLKGYYLGKDPEVIILYTGLLGELEVFNLNDTEIASVIMTYAINRVSNGFRPNQNVSLESYHPYFGGQIEYQYQDISDYLVVIDNTFITGYFTHSYSVVIDITVHYGLETLTDSVDVSLIPFQITSIGETIDMMDEYVTIQGTIIAIDYYFYDSFIYIYDGTGVTRIIDASNQLFDDIGKEVIISGYVYGGYFITEIYDHTIEVVMDYTDFGTPQYAHYHYILNNKQFNEDTQYYYYEIDGQVKMYDDQLYLVSNADRMLIMGNLGSTYDSLLMLVDNDITVNVIVIGLDMYQNVLIAVI